MYAPPSPAPSFVPAVQDIVVERVPRAAPEQGLRAGELIVSFRTDARAPHDRGHLDARVTVHGLGQPVWAEKAPFSKPNGRCLDAHAAKPLRSWARGRRVSVTIRTGDGDGHHRLITQRVRVVPFNLGDSEQAYATTVLDCFSILEDDEG